MPSWERWSASDLHGIDAVIRQADASTLSHGLARLKVNLVNNTWLAPSHGARNTNNIGPAPHKPAKVSLIAEYAAVSVPLHVADAWTYFGRALGAMASGSVEVAQHLLYYAELRAAKALLACNGVLPLGRGNFVLTATGTLPIPFPDARVAKNEHQAIWILLRQWSKQPSAAKFFGEALSFRGATLAEWTSERPVQVGLNSVLPPLLDGWGLDLNRFSRDRELRNVLSYNPTRIDQEPTGIDPEFVANILQELWMLLEPGQSNSFESLDALIFRQTFEAMAMGSSSDRRALETQKYRAMNDLWEERVVGTSSARYLADFLRQPLPTAIPRVFAQAGKDLSGGTLASQFEGMLGRALVLLRLATGGADLLMLRGGVSKGDINFWITDMLSVHGIRPPIAMPTDYRELYDDVRDVLIDMDELVGEKRQTELPVLKEKFARQVAILGAFERVPAWAVA